tara:strand:- start:527 stop:877 length:351 start_codon:yes stop_codon:yes gene_type:complete
MSNDLTNLSYRMSTQLDLAMNDLKNVKRNIKQINTIIKKDLKYNSERKIEYEEKYQHSEENYQHSEENYQHTDNQHYDNQHTEDDPPPAGFNGRQHNMTHNRWISSLRSPFDASFY